MAYNPTNWKNGSTPIYEANLNKIEQELALVSKSLKYNGNAPTDLNDARDFGLYRLQASYENAPITGNIYGVLIVYVSDGKTWTPRSTDSGNQWIWQEIRRTSGDIYVRCAVNTADSWTNWSQINYKDSGWTDVALNTEFKAYNDVANNTPRYRKIGNIVEMIGAISPVEEISDTSVSTTIFTLPSDCRPPRLITKLCQSSGKNTWLLRVETNGQVVMQRFGITEFTRCPAGTWLPFEVIFMVD